MLFSLPRKRGINIAKIRGNKVTDYTAAGEYACPAARDMLRKLSPRACSACLVLQKFISVQSYSCVEFDCV